MPEANRLESSGDSVPSAAVSEMRGKKAARAAPMLALAARRRCSAARMSGGRAGPRRAGRRRAPARRGELLEASGHELRERRAPTSRSSAWRSTATAPANRRGSARAASTWLSAWRSSRSEADADVPAALDEIERGLLRLERGLGQAQALGVGGEPQVARRDRGHQRDAQPRARLLGGEVLLERARLQAAQAPEQVDLPGQEPDVDRVLLGGLGAVRDSVIRSGSRVRLPAAWTPKPGESSARWIR